MHSTTDGPLSNPPSLAGRRTPGYIDPEERRALRNDAVHNAVLLHGEIEAEDWDQAERTKQAEAVLKTAERLYDWVVKND